MSDDDFSSDRTGQYDASADVFSIGNLMRNAHVTQEQLDQALIYQRDHPNMRLGEVMVILGFLSPQDVDRLCHEQRVLRSTEPSTERFELVKRSMEQAQERVGLLDSSIDRFNDLMQKIADKLSK